ncbi:hypothetical protein V6N11_061019 [Hibiscus sabdariffa]|uniref:Uncharacterized protein n=1 Tax=Hibiscus sabdariffa TaxID=183260 RepID=A0ABR2QSH4_9ROSI
MDCASKRLPALKLACHPHLLAYFYFTYYRDSDFKLCRYCGSCGKGCDGASIYRCVQCDISFHMECVVPSEAKQRYHRHPLMLVESVEEDGSDEFCCDVCENERDPKDPVLLYSDRRLLSLFDIALCCILLLVLQDQISYVMESEEAVSEKEMEQNEGTNVNHSLCNFKLDVKCAALTTHKTGVSQENKMDRVTELHHFTHLDKLLLAYYNDTINKTICKICELPILCPAYSCSKDFCSYIIHESCLRLPRKIQAPFYLNRRVVVCETRYSKQQCYVCPLNIKSERFAYSCEDYEPKLHPLCANSSKKTREIAIYCKMLKCLILREKLHGQSLMLCIMGLMIRLSCFKPLCDLKCRDPEIVEVCLNALQNILKVGGDAQAISNATSSETCDRTKFFVSQGCIKLLCDLLMCGDKCVVEVCLEGVENIVEVGEDDKNMCRAGGVNPYAQIIGDAGGPDKISYLQRNHDDIKIRDKAWKVYNTGGF